MCKDCDGSGICIHGRQKYVCIICHPDRACAHCKYVYVLKKYRFHPYCFGCYCVLHPEAEIPKRYKLKENYMSDYLRREFTEVTMVFDKRVEDGCSARRPDVRIDYGTHTVLVECDENQHRGYSCENKRMMELFLDCGGRPLVVLRLNPDAYESGGERRSGCFRPTKSGLAVDETEWSRRMETLVSRIRYHRLPPEKEITVEEFYYSDHQSSLSA
jgi:hypothetical protein